MPYATYRFNKIIAAETIRFIVTVAIVVYKGLKLVVYRMLTVDSKHTNKHRITTNKNSQLIRRESVGYFHTDKMLILMNTSYRKER